MYQKDSLSALDAITEAQRIAFAPMLFQTALCLRNSGILGYLDQQGKRGATFAAISEIFDGKEYAVSVLLDMGLSGRILTYKEERYHLSKIGHFLLHDPMTRVNMDFTQDVCYQGLFFLENALQEGKPSGLKVFGEWPTIYPALSQLPPAARKSWFAFDHYYSDGAFTAALPYVFASQPARLYDVGGNTGKWALRCCQYDENIAVTLLDLPQQIALARENIENAGLAHRIDFHAVDMLSDAPLPGEADIWWMSQFLDCFAQEHVLHILASIKASIKDDAHVCILEPIADRQKFKAADFAINAGSLYFTAVANGYSRFFTTDMLTTLVEKAGFKVEKIIDNLGISNSLFICKKA